MDISFGKCVWSCKRRWHNYWWCNWCSCYGDRKAV